MTRTILTCVIGSRLHGLENENSDCDYASVVAQSLRDVLSPFVPERPPQSTSADDHVTYELRKFCLLASQGNPTILEVIWSRRNVTYTSIAQEMWEGRRNFLSSKRIRDAHIGYAKSQLGRMTAASDRNRIGKAAAAYIRVLLQGISLIETGDFNPVVTQHRDLMLTLKAGADAEFVERHAKPLFESLELKINQTYDEAPGVYTPNVWWIEDFVYRAYMEEVIY